MRKHYRNHRAQRSPRINEGGAVSLPLAVLVLVCALGFGGTTLALHEWREQRDRQWALSVCVATNARQVSARLNRVRKLDVAIRATRVALLAAVEPGLRASLLATLQALGLSLRAEEVAWSAAQGLWLVRRGCGDVAGTLPQPYPEKPWHTPPPDPVGPRPPEWSPTHALPIRLWAPPRASRAWVVQVNRRWRAQWRPLGSGTS